MLIDVVHNHFGPSGCYLGELGPYVTDRYRTPWGGAVNVDGPGSDEVRRFFVESALAWLDDHHADGLRLDAVHAIVDTSARPFLEELGAAVADLARRTGRDLVVIAESDRNDPRLVHPVDRGGIGLDAHWCDDVHHALHVAATGETGSYYADFTGGVTVVADVLRHGYHHRDTWSAFRGRRHGRPPEGVGGDQLVAFLQNHDQVGNRAAGERIAHLAGVDRQLAAAALVLLGRFVPLVFQGEEWAASTPFPYFADHADPELAEAVRQGRIAEFAAFGWPPEAVADPEDPATAAAARLRWDEVTDGDHARALAWYRDLVALRRTTPALRRARSTRPSCTPTTPAWSACAAGRSRWSPTWGRRRWPWPCRPPPRWCWPPTPASTAPGTRRHPRPAPEHRGRAAPRPLTSSGANVPAPRRTTGLTGCHRGRDLGTPSHGHNRPITPSAPTSTAPEAPCPASTTANRPPPIARP